MVDIFFQSVKLKLPRKVTSSARVNLNKCWSKLGEFMSNASPKLDLPTQKDLDQDEPILLPFSDYFYPIDPVKPNHNNEENENAENQSIVNGQRFELLPDDNQEINDNLANEVREICYSKNAACFVCSVCY